MNRHITVLITLIVSVLVFSHSGFAAGSLKKWKDKDGQWHFGDVIPPEYSQQSHEELNKQGMTVEVQERAKTDAEIAEEKRLAAIEAEKQKEAEEKARHDRILLDTFSNVDDIEMMRDGKINAIDARISLAQTRIEKLREDLNERMETAASQERSGKTPNQDLLNDIESLRRQIKNQEDFIQAQNGDKDEVKASAEVDIKRYKELKSMKGEQSAESN